VPGILEGVSDRLVLFDIDCTLIDAHGAGGRAILRSLRDVYGVEGELGDYTFHGRTDPGIIRDLAELWGAGERGEQLEREAVEAGEPDAAAGRAGDETQPQAVRALAERLGTPDDAVSRRVEECIARYLELLRAEIAGGRVETLPGIRELVTALAADRRALVGLLTGNVEEGARLKLEPTGLLSHFRVGAYGSDSASRAELPAVAVTRAEALTGRRFSGKDVVVIGDTPADVECGASLGVTAVGVATGRHTVGELAACRPDHVFPDLSDWRAAYRAIMGEDGAGS
jgi:phosphoglycolate phosphatase-like HAD superfamily hydrolase